MKICPEVGAALEEAVREHAVAGASVCLIEDTGARCAVTGVAPSGVDTAYPVGSVTKPLLATLVCRLVASGAFNLDAPAGRLVPELAGTAITPRMLLAHTAGLADAWDGTASLAELLDRSFTAEPRKLFHYSNPGYAALGRLVENTTGRHWMRALHEQVLAPAGAASADLGAADGYLSDGQGGFTRGPLWPPASPLYGPAGAGLRATAAHTARVALACARGRTEQGHTLLPMSLREEMLREQVRLPGVPLRYRGWGLGWALPVAGPPGAVQHIGGTSAFVHVEPERGLALAVLTNTLGGSALGEHLLALLVGHRPVPPQTGPGPREVHRYLGEYTSPTLRLTVRPGSDASLVVTNPLTGQDIPLHHQTGDSFWADFGGMASEVTFTGDPGGRADRVHTMLRVLSRA
ncbi:serine hydrolase domain-containing protein [Lentzea sp. NPDC042327]|uniref:serine hydrolase domain-containing protein n=1 Tax=Lentzea sp. NPDC042327 TaxID=3154801 RepID=UPI00340596A1